MADFSKSLARVIKHEGGYKLVNDPNDPGGRTFAGISERHNPDWDGWRIIGRSAKPRITRALRAAVRERYFTRYWEAVGLSDLKDQRVADILFSTAVLSGVYRARQMLPIASEPGAAANMTVLRIAHYAELVSRRPALSRYFKGWVNRALNDFAEAGKR